MSEIFSAEERADIMNGINTVLEDMGCMAVGYEDNNELWMSVFVQRQPGQERKRILDADELLKRISEKSKRSTNLDVINGLCGATAIIYDMLIETGQERIEDGITEQ